MWKTYQNGNYTVRFNLLNGTKIRETEEDEFIPSYAENMDIKISNYCDMGCKFCHEGSTTKGKHGDIINPKFLDTLHPYQEVAIGGGDATSHPDLIPFLDRLKKQKIIANITVNQKHFMEKQDLIHYLVSEKLVYGVGVSLTNPTNKFIETLKKYDNAVLHVINGIITKKEIKKLSNHGIKMLILGYKHLRRGNDYFKEQNKLIGENQEYLKNNLIEIFNKFKVVSFDNLAIEQLEVQKILSPKVWEEFYMGDDGTSTYYIDMVEQKFAKSSTAPLDKRYDLLDSVDDMFQKIISE